MTHLFNGMGPFHHRAPGLAGVALADERVRVGLIADGVHVAPEAVALAQRALGGRLTLVTDAVAALGMPDAPAAAARLADGTLAGGTVGMDQMVRNLVAFSGCTPAIALVAASTTPAAVVGDPSRGSLASGCRADVVLLSPDLARSVDLGRRHPGEPGSGGFRTEGYRGLTNTFRAICHRDKAVNRDYPGPSAATAAWLPRVAHRPLWPRRKGWSAT